MKHQIFNGSREYLTFKNGIHTDTCTQTQVIFYITFNCKLMYLSYKNILIVLSRLYIYIYLTYTNWNIIKPNSMEVVLNT